MLENCNTLTDTQIYIAEKLNKRYHPAELTVASMSSLAPDQDDFPDLMTALLWTKMVGAEEHSANGIRLILRAGNHRITDNDILKAGIPEPINPFDVVFYLRDLNLEIVGYDPHKVIIEIETISAHKMVFENSKINIRNVGVRTTNYHHKTTHHFVFTGSEGHINNARLADIGTFAIDGSTVEMYGSVHVCSDFSEDNDFVYANKNSFILLNNVNFEHHELHVDANIDSRIYLKNCISAERLIYGSEINRRTPDLSIIYDEIRGDADQFDLGYKAYPNGGLVSNTAGTGFTIPIATDTDAGLIDPIEYKKLKEMREAFTPCHGIIESQDIDVGADERRIFAIEHVLIDKARVYQNGILVRDTEYTLKPIRDMLNIRKDYTILTFNTVRNIGDWISVEYMI